MRIDHIAYRVSDRDKTSEFFEQALGYSIADDFEIEFEDGTKIESVANRLISFPEEMKHRGTSCTDEKIRVVINFNYLT